MAVAFSFVPGLCRPERSARRYLRPPPTRSRRSLRRSLRPSPTRSRRSSPTRSRRPSPTRTHRPLRRPLRRSLRRSLRRTLRPFLTQSTQCPCTALSKSSRRRRSSSTGSIIARTLPAPSPGGTPACVRIRSSTRAPATRLISLPRIPTLTSTTATATEHVLLAKPQ